MEGANPFKKQAEEEKKRKQAQAEAKASEAKAKAAHKLAAKKKQAQAVEDEWLNDGFQDDEKDGGEESEEEHMGFQMFSGSNGAAGMPAPSMAPRQSKIVNLIDMTACQSQDDEHEPSPAPEMPSQLSTMANLPSSPPRASGGLVPTDRQSFGLPTAGMDPVGLLAEIEHLQQMLSDSKEESLIQVAIKDDEIAEKQQMINNLSLQLDASKDRVRELEEKLDADATQRSATESASPASAGMPDKVSTEAEAPGATAKLLAEARTLCEEAMRALQPGTEAATPQPSVEADAIDASATLADLRGAVATLKASVVEAAKRPPPPPPPAKASDEPLELKAVQALREMRLNAERQMAWIAERRADFDRRERQRLAGGSHAEAAGAA